MSEKDVNVEILQESDWKFTFDHEALEDIVVALTKLPEEKRSGIARKLLAAAATYCMAGSLKLCLEENGVEIDDLSAYSKIKMGKAESGINIVETIDLKVLITVPEENYKELEHCREILKEGSLITRSLERGIKVNHSILLKK
jgi:uncharacterized OsmC-like protein